MNGKYNFESQGEDGERIVSFLTVFKRFLHDVVSERPDSAYFETLFQTSYRAALPDAEEQLNRLISRTRDIPNSRLTDHGLTNR